MSTLIVRIKKSLLLMVIVSIVTAAAFTADAGNYKKIYFKDGSAVECDRVWKGPGDSVWYEKAQGVVGYRAEAVDMVKTFEVPAKVKQLVDASYMDFQKEDWDAVITAASGALELDGANAVAYTNRAGAYNYLGLSYKAIEDCDRALEIDPELGLAYNNRGHAFEMLGKTKEAVLDYQKGCDLGSELACRNCENAKE